MGLIFIFKRGLHKTYIRNNLTNIKRPMVIYENINGEYRV